MIQIKNPISAKRNANIQENMNIKLANPVIQECFVNFDKIKATREPTANIK